MFEVGLLGLHRPMAFSSSSLPDMCTSLPCNRLPVCQSRAQSCKMQMRHRQLSTGFALLCCRCGQCLRVLCRWRPTSLRMRLAASRPRGPAGTLAHCRGRPQICTCPPTALLSLLSSWTKRPAAPFLPWRTCTSALLHRSAVLRIENCSLSRHQSSPRPHVHTLTSSLLSAVVTAVVAVGCCSSWAGVKDTSPGSAAAPCLLAQCPH